MWSEAEFQLVHRLIDRGLSNRRISTLTGVSAATVGSWRLGNGIVPRRAAPAGPGWRPPDHANYCYLLGLYLGDGHISQPRGHPVLRIYLDRGYPGIIQTTADVLSSAFPDARVRVQRRRGLEMMVVVMNHPVLPFAFPQHGPGMKHTRPIALADWQARLTRRHPKALLRGLIHSDGCRCINRFSVGLPSGRVGRYEYVRYFFSNLSADIRRIFCDHCDLLGIRWSQSNPRNISVSHRDSVALLEEFVGPKR